MTRGRRESPATPFVGDTTKNPRPSSKIVEREGGGDLEARHRSSGLDNVL